ncbi:hypothetical protein [Desulfurobacterium sp.]
MGERKGLAIIAAFLITVAFFLLLSGCKEYSEINILAENKYILLPFYAEKAYGKLHIKNSIITLNHSRNSAEFIKLLNLSKYNIIIVDNVTYDFIQTIDNSWIKICSVGEKEPAVFKMVKRKTNIFYALNTPLYRHFTDDKTIYVDSFRELIKKNGIYFKEPVSSYTIIGSRGRIKYLLCVRKGSPAARTAIIKKILLMWEDGTTYIFDPAAVRYIMAKYNIKQRKDIDFLNCL